MRTGFYLYVPDADAVYAQAVAAGATPLAPPTDQSYGDRMGSVDGRAGHYLVHRAAGVDERSQAYALWTLRLERPMPEP